jgi:hypothetical protein
MGEAGKSPWLLRLFEDPALAVVPFEHVPFQKGDKQCQ